MLAERIIIIDTMFKNFPLFGIGYEANKNKVHIIDAFEESLNFIYDLSSVHYLIYRFSSGLIVHSTAEKLIWTVHNN